MLILHTVRAILRDAQMHEAAGQIQKEVDMMMQDVNRLDDRVAKLATHFQQAEKDISDIQTRHAKSRRGVRKSPRLRWRKNSLSRPWWTRPTQPDLLG